MKRSEIKINKKYLIKKCHVSRFLDLGFIPGSYFFIKKILGKYLIIEIIGSGVFIINDNSFDEILIES